MEKILISGLSKAGTAWLRGGVLHDLRKLSGRMGGPSSLPHCFAEKTEQGVFCSDSVFIGMLRHITLVTAHPVTYGVLP